MLGLFFIIVLFIILLWDFNCKEALTTKPNDAEKQKYINEILNNKKIFNNRHTYYSAKEKIPWMDAIIYEDVRQLVRQNNLNKNSVNNVFH